MGHPCSTKQNRRRFQPSKLPAICGKVALYSSQSGEGWIVRRPEDYYPPAHEAATGCDSRPRCSDSRGKVMKLARAALRVTVGAFAATFLFSAVQSAKAQTETVLYNFTSASESPTSPLVRDSAGNLYGTTAGGGPLPGAYGTVYELVNSSGSYTQRILYYFGATSSDGVNPSAG